MASNSGMSPSANDITLKTIEMVIPAYTDQDLENFTSRADFRVQNVIFHFSLQCWERTECARGVRAKYSAVKSLSIS